MLRHIDEARLETDAVYRYQYLAEFMGFDQNDIDLIHGAAPLLGPIVPALVDAVYEKLHTYDATWRHFVPRQAGYDGAVPESAESLTLDHEQIQFRKAHLATYLGKLVTAPYDAKMVQYLDIVGRIHTDQVGNKYIHIPLVQMNALLGFVADAFHATIFGLDLPADVQQKAIRAFSKLLWIQNDLICRHYATVRSS